MKVICGAFLVWGVLFLVAFCFGTNSAFQIMRGFWPLLTLLIAPIFVILALIALFKERRKLPPLIILLLAILAAGTFKKAFGWGAWINFRLHKWSYESVSKNVLTARDDEERKKICGNRCTVYHDGIISLSFPYSVGFLNWTQVIYDPIGIPRPKRPGDLHPNPPYDTYLVKAEPLAQNWYLCYFID
jgi:hypothetical protein